MGRRSETPPASSSRAILTRTRTADGAGRMQRKSPRLRRSRNPHDPDPILERRRLDRLPPPGIDERHSRLNRRPRRNCLREGRATAPLMLLVSAALLSQCRRTASTTTKATTWASSSTRRRTSRLATSSSSHKWPRGARYGSRRVRAGAAPDAARDCVADENQRYADHDRPLGLHPGSNRRRTSPNRPQPARGSVGDSRWPA